jgi:hypothetical protein
MGGTYCYDMPINNAKYDGRFTFMRMKYEYGSNGGISPCYYRNGMPPWAHGYDTAEYNLVRILDSISSVRPNLDQSNVYDLGDPEMNKYPIGFMTEAGFWNLSDKDALALRQYMKKGGFVIFDDFRPPPRGGGGWEVFETQMHRVLPENQIIDLDTDMPIFHSFFDIPSLAIIPQAYDGGAPQLKGIFEDNDPKKRQMAVINFNTDVSQFWEFSNTGFAPVDESNEAYKLGVNYIMYGLTH